MRSAVVAAAALGALVVVPGAHAADVTLDYEPPIPFVEPAPAYTLSVEAAAGEANRLQVARDEHGYLVREGGVALGLRAGSGCAPTAPDEVRCALTGDASHLSVFVHAGDGDDVLVLGPLPGIELAEALGGGGEDALIGGAGADLLEGGPGADVLNGGDGGDRLDGGPGDDSLDGGPGDDLVTYGTRRAGVTADLRGGVGGAAGERDELRGFEDVTGGHGADRLFGDAGANLLYGGLGGADVVNGRAGDDTLSARRAVGGGGDDTLDGKRVACGAGADLVARLRFEPPGPYARNCEEVRSFFYRVSRPRFGGRRLRFAFACPIRHCRGRFVVRDRGGTLGARRYETLGESFGGPVSTPAAIRLVRRPRGPVELLVKGQSLARDRFRLR